jgi:hypothetical protein
MCYPAEIDVSLSPMELDQRKQQMADLKELGPIYSAVIRHCPSYTCDGAWHKLTPPTGIRRAPLDAEALAAHLQKGFSPSDLLESGVVKEGSNGNLQLNPLLAGDGTVVIPLHETAASPPFDLMTGGGCVSGRELPVLAVMRDARMLKMIEQTEENILCVAMSAADAAILLSLNIPATVATGFAELNLEGFWQLRTRFQLYPQSYRGIIDHAEETRRPPPELIFVGCRLSELSVARPDGLSQVITRLSQLTTLAGVRTEKLYIWMPTARELDQIRFCLEIAGPNEVCNAVLSSIEESSGELIPPRPKQPAEELPKDAATAMAELAKALAAPAADTKAARKAVENLHRLLAERSVLAFFREFDQARDPIQGGHLLLAATAAQTALPLLARMFSRGLSQQASSAQGYPPEIFRQVMKAVDCYRKVLKDLMEYGQHPWRSWK